MTALLTRADADKGRVSADKQRRGKRGRTGHGFVFVQSEPTVAASCKCPRPLPVDGDCVKCGREIS